MLVALFVVTLLLNYVAAQLNAGFGLIASFVFVMGHHIPCRNMQKKRLGNSPAAFRCASDTQRSLHLLRLQFTWISKGHKMLIFLSWSKTISKAIAAEFNSWLPKVLPSVEPWMSSEAIQAGTRWSEEFKTLFLGQDLESHS